MHWALGVEGFDSCLAGEIFFGVLIWKGEQDLCEVEKDDGEEGVGEHC